MLAFSKMIYERYGFDMKNRKTTQIFRTLLAASLAMISVVSCSQGKDADKPEDTPKTPDIQTTAETEEVSLPPYPFAQSELDYDGYNFRILECWEQVDYLEDDLVAGEIVSEADFNRNSRVEELLNIEITAVKVPGDESDLWTRFASTVQTHVMAGDDAYDVGLGPLIEVFRASSNGHLLDLHELPTLDLTAPWWDQEVLRAFDFGNGKNYLISGGFNYHDDYNLVCLGFNRDLMERSGMELPYDAVRNGTWDFERDLNGDGQFDPYDQYGLITNLDFGIKVGCGFDMLPIRANSEGKPEFLLDEPYYDRFSAVIDVLCKDPSVVIMERQFGYDVGGEIFYHGNTLFTTATVSTTQNLRSAEFAGSIIPMPKYTEAQEHYMCSASDVYFTALCVPITVSDFDRTGYILDAMSYYGDEIIRPAAIDKQVLVKGVQDEDTEEMIRIIFDSKAVDLSFVTDWGGWPGIMHEFVKNAKNNLSSSEAKYTKRVNLAIRKSLEAFGLE